MKKTQRTFVFNPYWFEVLEQFDAKIRLEVLTAVNLYGAQGIESDLSPTAKMAFLFIRREMDYNAEQYQARVEKCRQAGRKGGQKRVDNLRSKSASDLAEPDENQATPSDFKQSEATLSYNDNVNVNDNAEDKSSSTSTTIATKPGDGGGERLSYKGGYEQSYESTRLLDDFFADTQAIASFGRANGDVDGETLRRLAEEVVSQWRLADTRHKSRSDARRHLMYQLRIKLKCHQNEKLTATTHNASNLNANQQNQLEIARLVQSKLADPFAAQRDISQCY